MKLISFVALLLQFNITWGYLGETYAPFIISLQTNHLTINEPIVVKPGDTIHITWNIAPGVRFPIYGYASSRTAKTDIGLLLPDASRTDNYRHSIDTELSLTHTKQYDWTIQENIPSGKYRIGIGFFYHEVSTEFTIQNENHELFVVQN